MFVSTTKTSTSPRPRCAPWWLVAILALAACGRSGSGDETSAPHDSSSDLFATLESPRTEVEVAGQWRPCVRLEPEESLEWNVTVPERGRLSVGMAMHPDAWVLRRDGLYVRIEVEGQIVAEQWICPRDVPAHRGWIDLDVDLAAWSGRRVRLSLTSTTRLPSHGVLRARESRGGESLLVSRPIVHTADSTVDNVLVVVIDTLRRDALHCYGHAGDVSPRIDALARTSIRFTRAWSTSPWTHPSTATLLSGWTPWQHGLGHGPAGTTQLDPRTPLLAEDFQRAGYATAAISGNSIVSPAEGFGRGFDHFDTRAFENEQSHSAQVITRNALQWIGAHRDQPFFAYLQYFDPHDRYQAPAPFTRRFVDPSLEQEHLSGFIRQGAPNPLREGLEEGLAGLEIRPEDVRYLHDLYQGEVAYVDHWVGRLLDQLGSWGILDRTLVVLTSDHGEEFYEHGFFKHGHSLYEELVAVPLIVKLPATWPHREVETVDTAVSLLDLAPTLRDLAGLAPRSGEEGRSWRGLLTAADPSPRAPLLFANYSRARGEWAGRQRGLLRWPYKWIEQREPHAVHLFDLRGDPGELVDLADERPQLVRELERVCTELYGKGDRLPHADTPVDPERLEKLKAMGYVH